MIVTILVCVSTVVTATMEIAVPDAVAVYRVTAYYVTTVVNVHCAMDASAATGSTAKV